MHVFKNGSDMTEEFNKVGHSKEAMKMLEKYLIKTDKNNNQSPIYFAIYYLQYI